MCCYGLNQPLFPSKNKFGRIIFGIVRLSAERILAKSEKWGVFGQILFNPRKTCSNKMRFSVKDNDPCKKEIIQLRNREHVYDDKLLVVSKTKQNFEIANSGTTVQFEVKNISQDTFVLRESSINYFQKYFKLNSSCEWEEKILRQYAGCVMGAYQKETMMLPGTTTVVKRKIYPKQGVYILKNTVSNISLENEMEIASPPLIVNGYENEEGLIRSIHDF